MKTQLIEEAYRIARERYAAVGVDTDEALEKLQRVSLSLHCRRTTSPDSRIGAAS